MAALQDVTAELAFLALALELGLMALLLAAIDRRQRAAGPGPIARGLIVLGRVPLFFYVVHLLAIGVLSALAVLPARSGSWRASWVWAAVLVAALWPLCRAYGRYKHGRRPAWTRYL